MATSSFRTLRLLSLLQSQRYWPGPVLADRLGVSVRTLRRDVDRLRELGYPVSASRGLDGGYQLAAGASLPPLVLDDEEAVALAVGLQAAAHSSVAGMAEASVRALTKVVQVMPQRLRRRVDALRAVTVPAAWGESAATPVDAVVLTTVAQACRDDERLRFGCTAASGRAGERHVEPHRLVSVGRRWYLVAYDLDRGDWRSFRLDRLTEPAATGARFAPRRLPAEDAAAFVLAGLGARPSPYEVEVVVRAAAAEVAPHIGRWGVVADLSPSSCVLRMRTDDLDRPAMALGSLGIDFTVRSPRELVDHVQRWAELFTRATARSDDTAASGTPPFPG
jgi:predicted DNA-binding transcriptional regulator YafY